MQVTERKLVIWFLTLNNPNTFLFAVQGPCISELDVTEYTTYMSSWNSTSCSVL